MAAKPKIVILSHSFVPYVSGAEFFVKEIVERLGNDYEFVILTSRFKKSLLKTEKMPGCLVKRVGFGLPFYLDKFLFLLAAPFYALKEKPAILHCVMESYAGIALIIFKFFNKKIPTILTLQCGDLDHPKKQKKIPAWLWRKIHTAPEYITAISSALAKRAQKLRNSPDNIFVIANGFNSQEIVFNETKIPYRIVCATRLSWEKGIEYLIKALPDIRKDFPETRLALIGKGKERDTLEKLAADTGVADIVGFRGFLEHQEALREIAKANVFVCPSLAEGLGNVFLEAQACKTAVIGANVGGIPDVIQNSFNGLLVPPQNSQAIALAVKKIFQDPILAAELIQNGFETVQKFTWENTASKINDLYQSIIDDCHSERVGMSF